LPHPRHLEAFEAVLPGASERIFAMAEASLNCQIEESRDERADRRLGMWLGFAALSSLVAAAVICGVVDQPALGAGFLATGAVGVVGKFIAGRSNGNSDTARKG